MIDVSIPGTRKLPKWLTSRVSSDIATRISAHWEDQHWSEVVRDTPRDTWMALAMHPKSVFRYSGNDGFNPRPDMGTLYCTYSNTERMFLGLMVVCWEALRAELVTREQRQELLDAEANVVAAQKRLLEACSMVPGEVVRYVLKRIPSEFED